MKNPKIVFILWVSWSWKTTLINNLIQDKIFEYIPSYTTRPIREWEKSWDKYIFVSQKEFKQSIKNWEFLEYAIVHQTNYYWTKLKPLQEAMQDQKIPIKEIDINWLEIILKEKKIKPTDFISIFLDIDDFVMTQRILTRQPDISMDEFEHRLESAQIERQKAQKLCNFVINADKSPDKLHQEVKTIILENVK